MKETLLRLLLLPGELETVEEWASVIEGGKECVEDGSVAAEEEERGKLLAGIDAVVPYLPDYSVVSSKMKALLTFCDSSQVDQLVQGWLRCTPPHDGPFRRWVLCDWLKCSHLTSAEPEALLQWRHALFVATTTETVRTLKWTLLKCLGEVDEVIGEQFEAANDDKVAATEVLQSIETVEELLDFCWVYAEQLSTCSLLCAAKLHALAVRTQRSAIKLAEDDDVMVRLRWSVLIKPMLFKPMLQHAVALKFLPGSITASQLWTSQELAGVVGMVDLATREKMLEEMRASRDELEGAFAAGVEHVYSAALESETLCAAEIAVRKSVSSLPVEKRKLLLTELERDLDEAPPHQFPHIFLFLSLLLGATLSSTEDQELTAATIGVLFSLFNRRKHDASSCMDALALQLRLSLSSQPLWQDNPSLYLRTVESLCETATLHVDAQLKWTVRMALQQMLFESDVHLLQSVHSTLSKFLPPSLSKLVALRLKL